MSPALLVPLPVRVDPAVLERIDRIAGALSKRAAGMNVKRADAFRVALERGVSSLEEELGLGPMPEAPPPPAKKSSTTPAPKGKEKKIPASKPKK